MTDQSEKKSEYVASYKFPVPSKGKAERFATRRWNYEVWNILTAMAVKMDGAAPTMLKASAMVVVFQDDYVGDEDKLKQFDELTPGLNATFSELVHGIYTHKDKTGEEHRLEMRLASDAKKLVRTPAYIVDPARKDGSHELKQTFRMNELLQACSGGDQLDRIPQRGRAPLFCQRVDKHIVGSVEGALDVRAKYQGWVFVATPAAPIVDLEKGTATFASRRDLGYAVYLPISMIETIVNLYIRLLPMWREFIEKMHDIVEERQRLPVTNRRFLLTAGREAPKVQEKAKENKPEGNKGRRRNRKAKVEATGEATPAEEKKDGDGAEPSSPPTAEA